MNVTGLVTALRAEAGCVVSSRIPFNEQVSVNETVALWLSGMGEQAARAAAEGLHKGGATALVSFGVAGALDPRLKPGDLILPDSIHHAGKVWPVTTEWRDRLQSLLPMHDRIVVGTLASSQVPLTSEKEKQDLAQATGACAVDMESGAIAEVAANAGIPFIVVRAIIDPVHFSPPAALLGAVYPDGGVNPVRLMTLILKRSVYISTLMHMGAGMRAARKTLSQVIQSAGDGLSNQPMDRQAADPSV